MENRQFALIDENSIVSLVMVCNDEEELNKIPGKWVEVFPDKEGQQFPGSGWTYIEDENIFLPPVWTPDLETIAQWGYPEPFEHLRPTE
jgi:hypothetical protein